MGGGGIEFSCRLSVRCPSFGSSVRPLTPISSDAVSESLATNIHRVSVGTAEKDFQGPGRLPYDGGSVHFDDVASSFVCF